MRVALLFIVAYLIGSIPFGYLIVRFKERADVRETGSGGTGATNVTRKAGKFAGVLTLFLDFTKGVLAIFVAELIRQQIDLGICVGNCTAEALRSNWFWNEALIYAAGVMSILGHCFPVWLKFRGGKGVATGLGVFFALVPIGTLYVAAIILVVALFTKYVSLGSIIGFALLPLFVWKYRFTIKPSDPIPSIVASSISALIIIFMHRENIKRLLRGEENKFR